MKNRIAMLWRLPGLGAFPKNFDVGPVPLALKRPKSSMSIPHKAMEVHQEMKMRTMQDCVGETPLVRLQRMVPAHSKSLVLCKLEGRADVFPIFSVQMFVFDLLGCLAVCLLAAQPCLPEEFL